MAEIIRICDRISYIKASEEPLSADVGIVEGDECVWLFDLGCSDDAVNEINSIEKPKNAVISHFHPDHMGNLGRVDIAEVFLGANTFKYAKCGTVVDTTGAGDTFNGVLSAMLANGYNLAAAARIANAVASLGVTRKYAVSSIPSDEEIREIILKN